LKDGSRRLLTWKWFIDMRKLPKTKEEIERLIVTEMHTFPDCEKALGVIVVPIADCCHTATWTVSRFNPGKSDGEACDCALQLIVPRFQQAYDIVRVH
jgi:hypothetical protein